MSDRLTSKAKSPRGRRVAIPPPRRVTIDMLGLAKEIPTVPVQKLMDLGPLVRARRQASVKISWCAIFVRALALTAVEHVALRRVFIPSRRPHLFESPYSVAMVAIEREYQGEPVVFTGKIKQPEDLTLRQIEEKVQYFKETPIEQIGFFKRTILLGRLPGFFRRLVLRQRFHCGGQQRVDLSGNFGISVYSSLGAESLHPIAPVTSVINYGVIREDEPVNVRLVYDHRVTDGSVIARALHSLDEILRTRVTQEILQLGSQAATQAA